MHLKAHLRHFCRHNSTRRPTQAGESTKCFSRHDTIFCAHPDTHFARIATQLEHRLAQNLCRGRDTTRASTCTKNVQRSRHNSRIDLHKIVHGSAQQPHTSSHAKIYDIYLHLLCACTVVFTCFFIVITTTYYFTCLDG